MFFVGSKNRRIYVRKMFVELLVTSLRMAQGSLRYGIFHDRSDVLKDRADACPRVNGDLEGGTRSCCGKFDSSCPWPLALSPTENPENRGRKNDGFSGTAAGDASRVTMGSPPR